MQQEEPPTSLAVRKRRYSPKVKTGCKTCRMRRIKCDETKPKCLRCASTGRDCDGYEIVKPLLFEVSTNPDEKWSFHYFRDRTASQISSFGDLRFWDQLIIQASYSEEAVRKVVTAVGAYHEAVDHTSPDRQRNQLRLALTQYNQAIARVIKDGNHIATESILMTCILFTFFENIRGNIKSAAQHLNAGLRILSEWRVECQPNATKTVKRSQVIDNVIGPILDNLHTTVSTSIPLWEHGGNPNLVQPPSHFPSLKEAHDSFYDLVQGMFAKINDPEADPQGWQDDLEPILVIRSTLNSWYAALLQITSETQIQGCACQWPRKTNHFDLGVSHLQIEYWCAVIKLEYKICPSEMIYDNHINDFRTIVNHCKNFMEIVASSPDVERDVASCLGFNPIYINALGFVAVKCRDPTLRREAAHLLGSVHRIESTWDSLIAAKMADHIIMLEEAQATVLSPLTSADVSSTARLNIVWVSFFKQDPVTKKLNLTYDFWNPDAIKLRFDRPSGKPHELEISWADLRPEGSRTKPPLDFPDDVVGLFPQAIEEKTALWHVFGTEEAIQYLSAFRTGETVLIEPRF